MIILMDEVRATIGRAVKELFGIDFEADITRPEEQFGDYATNAAMQLAPKVGKTPREIAEALTVKISGLGYYEKVEIAGPGFLNITLRPNDIWQMAQGAADLPKPLGGQEILVEFGDPNPFKEMHIGHLYSYIVGDSIARLLEANGATVRRLSYHGDVGLHVAKAIWGMQQAGGFSDDSADIGKFYAAGAEAYAENEDAKAKIDVINGHIYKQDDAAINALYEAGRKLSFDSFDKTLAAIGISTHRRYLESQSAPVGIDFVRKHTGSVFKQSEGAVIYDGEKVGLHTRVFITSKGLPTYEAKDLGLAELKNRDFPNAARSIIITANEQAEYFKVMLAALGGFDEKLAAKTTHLSHGFVNLSSGKMSSRTGDVYAARDLLAEVKKATHDQYPDSQIHKEVGVGAIKYAFSKHRIGPDLVFNIKESISLEGNSGPYLQYAYARANGILSKAKVSGEVNSDLDVSERSLARKISEYPEAVAKATAELMPHHIATYLYELAQAFNRFYEGNRVVGDARESTRTLLVKAYANTLKSGLSLLNIEAPDRV
jgi:arginyl-tRNA synthetase